MTQNEARRLCLRVMAKQLEEQGVSLNAEWSTLDDNGNNRSAEDIARVRKAARRLADEWLDRAGAP